MPSSEVDRAHSHSVASAPMAEVHSFPGRRFQVWEYRVGHKQLLLRSTKDGSHPTRVEIAFKDVRAMQIPTLIEELSISVADAALATDARAQSGGDQASAVVFAISGLGFRGYVVAGVAYGHEDQGEYSDPSPLLSGRWTGPGWTMRGTV